MPMLFKSNNRYLIRIYYYRCRISLEVFHSLSDGSDALKLLKTITAVYLRLKGNEISNTRGVLDINEPPRPEDCLLYTSHQKNRFPGRLHPVHNLANRCCGPLHFHISRVSLAGHRQNKVFRIILSQYLSLIHISSDRRKQPSLCPMSFRLPSQYTGQRLSLIHIFSSNSIYFPSQSRFCFMRFICSCNNLT